MAPARLVSLAAAMRNGQGQDTSRRLQIGFAGLVAVLLLIGLASIIGRAPADPVDGAAVADGGGDGAVAGEASKAEPLAELGVQPVSGNGTGTGAAPAAVPPGAAADLAVPPPPPISVPDLDPDPQVKAAARAAGKGG